MQTKVLRTGTNLIPRLNPNTLLTVNEDFSNGDLAAGSLNGTLASDGVNTRYVRDALSEIRIDGSEIAIETTNNTFFNTNWSIFTSIGDLTLPASMNYVFNKGNSGRFRAGFTDLHIAGRYWAPEYGIEVDLTENVFKVIDGTKSLISGTFPTTLTSLVLSVDDGDICTVYWKTDTDQPYEEIDNFDISGYDTNIYFSYAVNNPNASNGDYYFNKMRLYVGALSSAAQLEALFPL